MLPSPWAPLSIIYPDGTKEKLALFNAITSNNATPLAVTALPNDLIIFMLGNSLNHSPSRGIYIASLRTHKIAKISNGRSPLVVIDDKTVELQTKP